MEPHPLSHSAHPARPAALRSGVALAGWGLLVVLVGTLVMMLVAAQQLRTLAETEAEARAQRIGDALASRVQRAVSVGVPLDMLEGVDALFEQRMRSSRDIDAVALAGADRRLLWLRSASGSATLPEGPQVVSAVQHDGQTVARIIVVWKPPQVLHILGRWAVPLLGWGVAVAALAALVLRWSWARGPCRRDAQVAAAAQRVLTGDYDWRLPADRRRDFDPRTGWLSAEIRHANELHLRIRRLVHSLRHTEPDAGRRAELEAALERATGTDRFRTDAPPQVIEAPGRGATRQLRGVGWGVAAWLLGAAGAALLRDGAPWVALIALLALGGAWAVGLALELRSTPRRALGVGLGLGLLLAGPGLVVPWVLATGALAQARLGPWAEGLALLVAVATLAVGCTVALRHRRQARQLQAGLPAPGGDRAA